MPGDDGFVAEVSGFDPLVVPRPDVAVGAASADDIAAAVRFARRHGLQISLMGSGHADLPARTAGC